MARQDFLITPDGEWSRAWLTDAQKGRKAAVNVTMPFAIIKEVEDYATSWLWTYNNDPHNMGLGGIAPVQKLKQKLGA